MKLKDDEDKMKLKFTLDALKSEDPFTHTTRVPDSVSDAIKWQSARSPQEVMRFQNDLMNKLEAEASKMWSEALCTISFLIIYIVCCQVFGSLHQMLRQVRREGQESCRICMRPNA